MHSPTHFTYLAENPCKPGWDKWGRQILAKKHEYLKSVTRHCTPVNGPAAKRYGKAYRKISKNWAGLAVDLNRIHHTKHDQYVDLLPF